MIKAVIYDMDGLLVDSEPLWREAEIDVFGRIGLPLTDDQCRQTMGLRLDEVVAYWYQLHPWKGASLKEVETQILDEMERLLRAQAVALPGVYESMELFAARKLPMALASSSPMRLINAVVEKLEIGSHLSVIQSAETEALGKPHPGVFLTTASRLQVPATSCLVFEDSVAGVIAALAARMKAVAIPEEAMRQDPRYAIAHLTLPSLADFSSSDLDRFTDHVL